jgi:prolyl oligopeptidase
MAGAEADDPLRWLEDVRGERALAWVRERNARTRALLTTHDDFAPIRERLLAVLNAAERIPHVARHGDMLYNLWQDAAQLRGLWRRTTLAEYRKPSPAWETVLDLDALAAAEGENWVFRSARFLGPDHRLALLALSRGGADATVVREFDTRRKRFVDGGFHLGEAKTEVEWIDADTIYVGTDFGPGSTTTSGYPRIAKRGRRGTPLAEASTVFEGEPGDAWVYASVDRTPGHERTLFVRGLDFYRSRRFLLEGDTLRELDVPADAAIAFWNHAQSRHDTLLVTLSSDWAVGGTLHRRGALLAIGMREFLAGGRDFTTLFTPTPTRSLAGHVTTRRHVVLNVLDNVAGRVEEWRRTPTGFVRREVAAPHPGAIGLAALHAPERKRDPHAERYWLACSDFLAPDRLLLARTGSDRHTTLKALPAAFDAAGMRAEQRFASSADGTRVPYFVVRPRDDGAPAPQPTLLYGYGGFEQALTPWYLRSIGSAWLERGGVFVVANIRGGGEFGPAWHQAALRERRQRAFDDFIAVAEDLIAQGLTQPRHLGIMGGSNGGLLVGAAMTQRPELFGAVVCQVPLLDMRRYHRLLAGASWMAEYGDPDDPADWDFIGRYSPYHNLREGVAYPPVLFTTSTRDDRVHPGHARKMAAQLLALGQDALLHENLDGGHGLAADNAQRADVQALEFSFLWRRLARRRA